MIKQNKKYYVTKPTLNYNSFNYFIKSNKY